MTSQTVFVISDLHVGINDTFDIFKSVGKIEALRGFLDYASGQQSPVELIINGDIVDFLQVKPWDDFSRGAALQKIKQIVEKSEEVFHALGKFLAVDTNHITVLLGNHDVELAYPEVWEVVRKKILEIAPDAGRRIAIQCERISYRVEVNRVTVHLEHGNYDDQWNHIDYTSLTNASEIGTSFEYPPGTKMVYQTMNTVKETYQFVDVLKPEFPAVFALLLALKPSSIDSLPGFAKELFRSIGAGIVQKLRDRISGRMMARWEGSEQAPQERMSDQMSEAFSESIDERLIEDEIGQLEKFLAPPEHEKMYGAFFGADDFAKLKLINLALEALVRYRMLSTTGADIADTDYPEDAFAISASKRFQGTVQAVVYGHTHEPLKTVFREDQIYVNSGTWADVVRLPPASADKATRLKWLQSIEDNTFERTAFPTFVEIRATNSGASISLNSWHDHPTKIWSADLASRSA